MRCNCMNACERCIKEYEDLCEEYPKFSNINNTINKTLDGKVSDLIKPCPPNCPTQDKSTLEDKITTMGITISPPMYDNREAEIFIYLYMTPILEIIADGTTTVHCEFSEKGRLHYHIIVNVPNSKYGQYYRFISTLQNQYRPLGINRYKIKYKQNKRIYIKSFTLRAQVDICLQCKEYTCNNKTYKSWNEYCTKDIEKTEKILGIFHKIDKYNLPLLRQYIENKFSITVI